MKNLTFHLKKLEEEEDVKPKASKKKEILKITAERNKTENRRTIGKTKVVCWKRLTKLPNP